MKTQPHPLDRRHLKEVLHKNELSDSLAEAGEWAKAHLEAVLVGVLVLAALAFGVVFFVKGREQKALDVSLLLDEAQNAFQQAASAPPDQAAAAYAQASAKYQAITASYPGTLQSKVAQLGLANADLALGKGDQAEREYAALDDRDPKDSIAALAALGRARALELEDKPADALAAYAAVLGAYPGSAVEGEAKQGQARLGKQVPAAGAPSAPVASVKPPRPLNP